jgi:hypothetical protein
MARDQQWLVAVALAVVVCGQTGRAQTASVFVAGGRELYALDLKSSPSGGLPKGIRLLRGKPTIVTKDEGPMLKASEPTEFLVTLSEFLPDAFTLEFEIIPKACCNPEDISFEGTATQARSTTSMHVVWHPATIIAVGGGDYVQIPMPQDLSEVLASNPTKVEASFEGTAFKLFTNGRKILDLPNKRFARGRVLRVFLGGQDGDRHAVYLSKLRIAATSGAVASTKSADLQSTVVSGGTLTEAGTGTIPTVAGPATTSVNVPKSVGVTAGPAPTGVLVSPTATVATQPATATSQGAMTIQPASPIQTIATPSAPAPSDKTVSGSTAPTIAGPASLTIKGVWEAGYGWGVQLKWPAISGVTTYWVSRKGTDSSDPARYVEVLFAPSPEGPSTITAIDPYLELNAKYTYWVVGYTRDSGETKPSPLANIQVVINGPAAPGLLKVENVTAPQMLTMPGPLAAVSPMLGSAVRFVWGQQREIYLYQISYEIVGGFPGVGPVLVRATAPSQGAAGTTFNVPQGKTVKLCVHAYASDKAAPLPTGASCVNATAP